ncbi:FAD-binding oxidoreductase [Candidatus Parabeggiatoa sp. HSG14]|uniref:FAD-binding oxidoreductase n=1 Tax=Candidatus Parabeggiatoa sp. HSG14 TaxID=3055593 RepID=UPI0025A783AE|nr:FAD-binding oxidoreductase [Thiotrichales bacterium HSG14]
MSTIYQSWGNFPKVSQRAHSVQWRKKSLPDSLDTMLPHGLGRSYGDVCLNENGMLLTTRTLNHFIDFDIEKGVLRCEAGVSLAEILELVVPHGWFLPTTPGTKFVTVGGAIANDVHGKNHHCAGTFGRHVLQFELLRSDGERLLCSPTSNEDYFAATISGLGLTGLVTWVEIQLKRIYHRAIQAESIKFNELEEFFEISTQSDQYFDYTVAWIDCNARGAAQERGIFFRGNHVSEEEVPSQWQIPFLRRLPPPLRTMPINLPCFMLNRWSVSAFNWLYYNQQRQKTVSQLVDYDPFFYPLDVIFEWRRLYGKGGFLQYQFVVPDDDHRIIKTILQTIAASGMSSFLAVLKTFGHLKSPGMLSFPRKGVTLALDFPIKGATTFELLERLDDMVREAGGSVYPCKDARLSARNFQAYYPQWTEFSKYIDPRFSSSFWQRVSL